MPTQTIMSLELALTRLHRALWNAVQAAEQAEQDDLAQDLGGMLRLVGAEQESLARKGRRLRTRPLS